MVLTDKPIVTVIEKITPYAKVTITTQSSIIPFWVYEHNVECGPISSSRSVPQFQSAYQKTGDGFVWKDGSRIGWVDERTDTYFRLDQLETSKSASPTVKAGAEGRKILSTLDAAIAGSDQAAAAPPEATIERTGDGFVWRNGKRIGWVGMTPPQYYRIDQVETGREGSPILKSNETGQVVGSGRLIDAVNRAEAASK